MFLETAETFGKPQLVPPFLTCTDSLKTDTFGFSLLILPSNTAGIALYQVSEYGPYCLFLYSGYSYTRSKPGL